MCGMESERGEDFGDGGTDCHGQCSHWPRNDIGFSWGCGVRRGTWAPPYKGLCEDCGRTGAFAPTQSKEMRTSTDGRGRTPPLRKRCKECGALSAGGQGRPPLHKARRCEQARTGGVEPRPYGSVTRSVTSIGRADVGIGPYGENLGRTKGKSKRIPEYPLAFDRSEELEVLDDVNDFSTDALLSLQGGGTDMSGRLENVPVAHF